jgi:hypothetical protein
MTENGVAQRMSQPPDNPAAEHQRPVWHFLVALAVVLAGVALGTMLIIPRGERGRSRPAVSQPAPFTPKATNQIIIRD